MKSTFVRALAALLLAATLAACGSVDVGSLVRQVSGNATAAPAPAASAADSAPQAAVKQTIQSSNEAQAKAFAKGDPSAMRQFATDSFYQQLVQTNRDLASSGVTSISLVGTDWGEVNIDGDTAKATTYETWRSTYSDGSSDEATARNDYTLVLQNGSWKIDADDQPSAVLQPAPQTQTDTGSPTAATKFSTSSNWSGYAATGGSFSSVTGTWTVPNVSATTSGADATWVGIGGIDTRDLIQAGTQATVSGGDVQYDAWIEMLPASSRPVSLSVNPGDSVTVTITQKTATEWTIAMKNNTTGGRYTTTVTYTSTNSSAEWVQEAPSIGRGTVALDQFGTLRFTDASAIREGQTLDLTKLGAEAITMINDARQSLATPSIIGTDGTSFTVTRTDAPSTSGGGTRRRRG
jgi:peptidase A4-like protein